MKSFKHLYICIILFVTACSMTDYDSSVLTVDVDNYKVFSNVKNISSKTSNMQHWWRNIEDPIFNKYVDELLKDNLSLKQAAERIIQAKEVMNISGSDLLPSLSVDVGNSRSFAESSLTNNRAYTSNLDLKGNVAWQIDLFGKVNKSLESSTARFHATIYDLEALEHSLIAELLKTRIDISVNQEQLRLYKKMANIQKQIYKLTEERYSTGVKGLQLSHVYEAEKNYMQAKSVVSVAKTNLIASVYKLDVLLGNAPNSTDISKEKIYLMPIPKDIAIYAPVKLLDRRPDLKSSRLRVIAAMSDIDIAVADLYPSLNIGASLGFTGNKLSNFLTADKLAGSIATSITTALFSGGALRANIRLEKAEMKELAHAYSEDVLEAFKEVEVSLKQDSETASVLINKKTAFKALQSNERMIKGRYNKGIEPLSSYLVTSYKKYVGELDYITAQQDRWNARINLYLSLGGDWK